MKINEMILVTENRKGTEKNCLMTTEDYLKYLHLENFGSREEMAKAMVGLGATLGNESAWAEHYFAPNISVSARFCKDEVQLSRFLAGYYDDMEYPCFDKGMCSAACMDKLEQLGMDTKGMVDYRKLSYMTMKEDFKVGQILHNFNGSDYRVMEKLSEKNLLLMDERTGKFIVAQGVEKYARYPRGTMPSDENSLEGIEWARGVYLSNVPSDIDFRHLRQEYGTERKIETINQYREMLTTRFRIYEKLKEDELLSGAARKMIKSIMSVEFEAESYEQFVERLNAGHYDCNFNEWTDIKKDRAR